LKSLILLLFDASVGSKPVGHAAWSQAKPVQSLTANALSPLVHQDAQSSERAKQIKKESGESAIGKQ